MFQQKTNTKTNIFSAGMFGNVRMIIYLLTLGSVFAYLLIVNNTNTLGIKMGQMKYDISTLTEANRDLEALATGLQAMARIEQISNTELSMVQAGTYDYVLAQTGEVAVK
ncbi:MAG: hypothetical protein Q8P32_02940 [Candidatus Komeilibacteria bacterium]|nr:hypothetical protein [Candidatus Komeilibacteria bacterium]